MKKELERETNCQAFKKLYKEHTLSCSFCPPNRYENRKRKQYHGKERLKDKKLSLRRKLRKTFSHPPTLNKQV